MISQKQTKVVTLAGWKVRAGRAAIRQIGNLRYGIAVLLVLNGCVVCSRDRVFPTVAWRWSSTGQRELSSRREEKAFGEQWQRDHYSQSISNSAAAVERVKKEL